jgi:hypothetical protein
MVLSERLKAEGDSSMVKHALSTLLFPSVLLAMIFSPGHSRQWKPTPDTQAGTKERPSGTNKGTVRREELSMT